MRLVILFSDISKLGLHLAEHFDDVIELIRHIASFLLRHGRLSSSGNPGRYLMIQLIKRCFQIEPDAPNRQRPAQGAGELKASLNQRASETISQISTIFETLSLKRK